MTLIYDPIEALQRIQELVDDDLWRLDDKDFTLGERVESLPSVICDLDEVSLICDTVLFKEGLKER